MRLEEYFENTEGVGILSTADDQGNVNCAVYATPHVIDKETIGFIMRPRKSYSYVKSNPRAAYMFMEEESAYRGIRLTLEKVGENSDPEDVDELRRSFRGGADEGPSTIVNFKVTEIRPLVGEKFPG
jgi:hypothetical protein